MPVNRGTSPARARRYRPLTSRCSQTSSGHLHQASMKSPLACMARTRARSALSGEMNAARTMMPVSANRRAVSPARRRFSLRSSGEKPRSAHRPWRRLSPSSSTAWQPAWNKRLSTARASVVLPAPDKPVNQTTAPRWPCISSRSRRDTWKESMMRLYTRCRRAACARY